MANFAPGVNCRRSSLRRQYADYRPHTDNGRYQSIGNAIAQDRPPRPVTNYSCPFVELMRLCTDCGYCQAQLRHLGSCQTTHSRRRICQTYMSNRDQRDVRRGRQLRTSCWNLPVDKRWVTLLQHKRRRPSMPGRRDITHYVLAFVTQTRGTQIIGDHVHRRRLRRVPTGRIQS